MQVQDRFLNFAPESFGMLSRFGAGMRVVPKIGRAIAKLM